MLCAISGEAPQDPVASRKSGNIYERRLIEAYITENGTEPTTGESLSSEDLIGLKSSKIVRPRPPTLTSIPSLLAVFQEEWDALALEAFSLKANLAQTRQELSTALYQQDAAVRVIARLTKERDEARDALSKISISGVRQSNTGDAMDVDTKPLPAAVLAKIDAAQESLSKTRRKRPVPVEWATADTISSFEPTSKSEPFYPGSTTLAIDSTGDLIITGGADGIADVYSVSSNRLLRRTMKGGGGSITGALWAGNKAVISTSAGAVKVYEESDEISSFQSHSSHISAIALHPSGDIVASVGEDAHYSLYDISSGAMLTQIGVGSASKCAQFHPDGHLLAVGTANSQVKIFDTRTGQEAAAFDLDGPAKALFFSENGTWLAVVTKNSSTISIWDLRKGNVIKSLDAGLSIDSVSWDYTGQFLAAVGREGVSVQHYSKASKEWTVPLKLSLPATAIIWGQNAQSAVTVNKDGVLTVLSA